MQVTVGFTPVSFRRIYFVQSFFVIYWKLPFIFSGTVKWSEKILDLVFSFHFEGVYMLGW